MLNKKITQILKAKAHKLNPVVLIGNKGISENVLKEIDRALHDHELIKIKLSIDDRELKKQAIIDICRKTHSDLVQTIGHIAVLYRQKIE